MCTEGFVLERIFRIVDWIFDFRENMWVVIKSIKSIK